MENLLLSLAQTCSFQPTTHSFSTDCISSFVHKCADIGDVIIKTADSKIPEPAAAAWSYYEITYFTNIIFFTLTIIFPLVC